MEKVNGLSKWKKEEEMNGKGTECKLNEEQDDN